MKKILIVDGSVTTRQSVKIPLQCYGYQCLEAVDGIDALRKLSDEVVDMIITDIDMPNLSGLELIKEVRKARKSVNVPIIVLSIDSSKETMKLAREAGANCWISKPFRFGSFLKYINLLLKN